MAFNHVGHAQNRRSVHQVVRFVDEPILMYETERPAESSTVVLLLCGTILLLCSRFSIVTESRPRRNQRRSFSVLLDDDEDDLTNLPSKSRSSEPSFPEQTLDRHTRQRLLKFIVGCVVLRVGTLWLIVENIQCSNKAVEVSSKFLNVHSSRASSQFDNRLIKMEP